MIVTIPIAGAIFVTIPDGLTKEEAISEAWELMDEYKDGDERFELEWEPYSKMASGNAHHYTYSEIEVNS